MSIAYSIEAAIVALERARRHAVTADIGEHFTSEIDHLIETAKANREAGFDETPCSGERHD